MVELQLPKLLTRVRFPSLAPFHSISFSRTQNYHHSSVAIPVRIRLLSNLTFVEYCYGHNMSARKLSLVWWKVWFCDYFGVAKRSLKNILMWDWDDLAFANKELFYWQTLTVPKRAFDKQSGKGPIKVNFIMRWNCCQIKCWYSTTNWQ